MRGIQSALEPAGMHAEKIGSLWDLFLVVCACVYVLVMIFLVVALFRRPKLASSRGVLTGVVVASGITVLILFGFIVASVATGRAIASIAPKTSVEVVLTGHQWWWQVDYNDQRGVSHRISTANELYIPVGIPVRVFLRSTDVIHSFWVPNLHGKQDLIPGHENAIVLHATRPGVFRGQCAEFCGYQHAKMAFWVTALPPAEFAKWADSQRKPSNIPATPSQRKGQEVFLSSPCPLCHTVQGTPASGKVGPDLTHVASRRSIAAGTLPNRRGYLAGWILDPQHIKPGAYMPPTQLRQGELEPLLDYLESLQ